MAEGTSNGHDPSRLDRLERIVSGLAEWQGHLAESHEKLVDSQKHLLHAQGVLHEEVLNIGRKVDALAELQRENQIEIRELRESQAETNLQIRELRDAQKGNEDQIHLLIRMVDDWIRRSSPPQA